MNPRPMTSGEVVSAPAPESAGRGWLASTKPLASAVLLGCGVRILSILLLHRAGASYPDEDAYWTIAGRILDGHGLSFGHDAFDGLVEAGKPTAYFGAFPLFLTPLYKLVGGNLLAGRLILSMISWLALSWGIRRYGREVFSPRVALVAVLWAGVHPNLVFLGSWVMTESVYLPLAVIVLLMGRFAVASTWAACATGLAYGIAHLTRLNLLLFQPLHAVSLLLRGGVRRAVRPVAISLLATGITVGPWLVRNYLEFGEPVFETKSGLNLLLMNNPLHQMPMLQEDFSAGVSIEPMPGLNEAQKSSRLRSEFYGFVREHPRDYLRLCGARFLNAFALLPTYARIPGSAKWAVMAYNGVLYGLFLIGLARAAGRRDLSELTLLCVYCAAWVTLTNASMRHRVTMEPAMLLLASWSIIDFARHVARRLPWAQSGMASGER